MASTLTADQFQQLLGHISTSLHGATATQVPKEENPFAIACTEYYISQGLSLSSMALMKN
jgi:hypothetical protein